MVMLSMMLALGDDTACECLAQRAPLKQWGSAVEALTLTEPKWC